MQERDNKILEWNAAVTELAAAKEKELKLRKELLFECFNYEEDNREGTENVQLGNGYKLKAGFKLYRRLTNTNGETEAILDSIEATGPEGALLADRVVKWKPELSISEYKKLPENFRKMLDSVVTSTPGTPSLEFVVPKKAK